jgi:hypothetical protein
MSLEMAQKVIVPQKKNYVPQFLKQRDINSYKKFSDFLNVCSANILVLTGLQHQYIGAVQGESKCFQHHAYFFKHCLFSQQE